MTKQWAAVAWDEIPRRNERIPSVPQATLAASLYMLLPTPYTRTLLSIPRLYTPKRRSQPDSEKFLFSRATTTTEGEVRHHTLKREDDEWVRNGLIRRQIF